MNRRVFIALAVAAMAFSTSTASAGGSGSKTQIVRIKNIGSSTVRVVAVTSSGATEASLKSASRLLSQNAVTQYVVKKGTGLFVVSNDAFTTGNSLEYNFPNSTYVYLQAKEAAGVYTPSFAPPGTRF